MTKRSATLIGALAVVVGGVGVWSRLQDPGDPPSPVVARVNGAQVSERDVAIRLSELLPMASFHGHVAPETLLALRRTALDELVFEELILQEATHAGISPDEADVDLEVASVRSRFGSDAEFEQALASIGLTTRGFLLHMQRAVLLRRARAAMAPPAPTGTDIQTYYGRHAQEFVRPERVHLLELLVAIDPAGGRPAERKAQTRVKALLRELRAGADFGRVAWETSEDAYRVKNGDLGWVHRGRLDVDLEAAAFAAPIGELRVARSLSGFHLFKVLARDPERQLTLDEARASIADRLRRERALAVEREWHRRLELNARIEILDVPLARAKAIQIPNVGATPGGFGRPQFVASSSH